MTAESVHISEPLVCTYPVGEDDANDTCDRRAVVVYMRGSERLDRCARHNSRRVQLMAEQDGWKAHEVIG